MVCQPSWIAQQLTMSASRLGYSVPSGSSIPVEHNSCPLALLTQKTHPTFCPQELNHWKIGPQCLYSECLAHTYIALKKQKFYCDTCYCQQSHMTLVTQPLPELQYLFIHSNWMF